MTAVARPSLNSIPCSLDSESWSLACLLRLRRLYGSISQTVFSKKSDWWPQSHRNEDGITRFAMKLTSEFVAHPDPIMPVLNCLLRLPSGRVDWFQLRQRHC